MGVGHRLGLDPMLSWLWHRPAAIALIRHLAWEAPYAAGAPLKRKKNKRTSFVLVFCLLYQAWGTSGFLDLCSARFVHGSYYSRNARLSAPSYGCSGNACVPLDMQHMVLWPWTWVLRVTCHETYPLSTPGKLFIILTRGSNSTLPALTAPLPNYSILRDDKYAKLEAREAKRLAQCFTVSCEWRQDLAANFVDRTAGSVSWSQLCQLHAWGSCKSVHPLGFPHG